jgi:hypothetical protein
MFGEVLYVVFDLSNLRLIILLFQLRNLQILFKLLLISLRSLLPELSKFLQQFVLNVSFLITIFYFVFEFFEDFLEVFHSFLKGLDVECVGISFLFWLFLCVCGLVGFALVFL